MRVLHINGNYIYSALHQNMLLALDRTGVESYVFVPKHEKAVPVIEPAPNVHAVRCFNKNDRFFFYRKQGKIVDEMRRIPGIGDFDCIHAYTVFTDGNSAMEISREFGIPYIVAVRNTDVNEFFKFRLLLRKRGVEILKNASAVLFLSDVYRKQVLELYVPEEYRADIDAKSCVIPNGIDDFWFDNIVREADPEKAARAAAKSPRLLYAGAVNRNKNPELTAEAVELLAAEGWNATFTTVGKIKDGAIAAKLEKYHSYRHLDAMPKEELINVIRDHDIFVMPSHTETFGLVYAEAMSQGLPVIYTKGQGFDGQFEEGAAGYSVDDRSAEDLAEKIKKTAENYTALSLNASSLVEKFRWSRICGAYAELYKKIAAGR